MNPNQRSEKTDPIPIPPKPTPSDAETAFCAEFDFSSSAARSRAHRLLTPCIRMHHQPPLARSKPFALAAMRSDP